jgi:phosphonate transport system ATP-binding protein
MPRQLTDDVLRDIYGSQGLAEFSESVTSTTVHVKVPA